MKGADAVSRWSRSRVDPDDPSPAGAESPAGTGSPAGGDESADLSSRLVQQAAELREARSDQAAAWVRLNRAEDRAAALDWQLESIQASRGYRLIRVLRQARSARALLRMPLDGLRVLTTAAPRPPRPADPGLRGRAEHTRDGWEAYDRRDYGTALAEAGRWRRGCPGRRIQAFAAGPSTPGTAGRLMTGAITGRRSPRPARSSPATRRITPPSISSRAPTGSAATLLPR